MQMNQSRGESHWSQVEVWIVGDREAAKEEVNDQGNQEEGEVNLQKITAHLAKHRPTNCDNGLFHLLFQSVVLFVLVRTIGGMTELKTFRTGKRSLLVGISERSQRTRSLGPCQSR